VNLDPLQFKVLGEGMHGAISPYEIVLLNRRQKLRPLRERAGYGVEHKPRVKCRDECNIHIEARGILDFCDLHSIHLLALLVGNEIDFAHTIAVRQTLKNAFKGNLCHRRSGPGT